LTQPFEYKWLLLVPPGLTPKSATVFNKIPTEYVIELH